MVYDFQKEYTLLPQSPLLHFQYDSIGATLRATEVKPKLDRFLLKKAEKERIDTTGWKNKKHPDSLDYRLHFEALESNAPFIVGAKDNDDRIHYDIYYGNMGSKVENPVMGVINKTKMTVTCFNADLRKFIDKHLDRFFIVTNFGRMQNKGFGSFIINRQLQMRTENITEILKEEYGVKNCYYFSFKQQTPNSEALFKCIKTVYSLIKSGINFKGNRYPSLLFQYMKENGFGNEKMWLLGKGIAPIAKGSHYPDEISVPNNPHYVRALFGVGDHIDFLNDVNDRSKKNKTTVSITSESKEIQRFPSPVLFKIINKQVYFVGRPIDDCIFGQAFLFSSSKKEDGETLTVPKKEELPADFINDFMNYCCEKLNDEALIKFRDTENLKIKEG